ncbi:hypothetical protein PFTANZ_01158 [Plasmodium falciparum Tanzania (2000708)]|nr:hypothetical protein PFTANZ_01158 [Plasmodium falciparum Tanzania (2000708)]
MTYPPRAEKTVVPHKCNKEEEYQEDVYNANTSNPTSLDIYNNSTTYENQRKKKRNIIIKQECNEEMSSNNDQNYVIQKQNNDIIIKEGTIENILKTYEDVIITNKNIEHNNNHTDKGNNEDINNLKNVENNLVSNNNNNMELLNYKNKCCISNEIELQQNNVDNEKMKQMKVNYNVKDKNKYMNKKQTNKLNNNNNNNNNINIFKTCNHDNQDEMYQSRNHFDCKEYPTKIPCCYKHNELHSLSLLKNHECKKIKLPYYCIKILQGHKDEVWYVNVSPNGKYIASSSKDKSIFLWKGIYPFNKMREWNGHIDGVSYIIWSHNSKYLVSGSNDSNIIIWSPKSNKRKLSLNMHSGPITSICWSKDDSIIVSSAFDKKIFCTKLNEELKSFSILYAWSFSTRIQNFVFTNNDQYLIVVASDKNVRVIDYNQKKELYILPEFDTITSVCASKLYNHILVNIADQKPTIKLWDVKYRYIIQTYRGHKQGRFIVHSTFGGKNEDYVISGSEDSLIYIWHKTKGYLLDVINGHASTVSIAIWPLSYSKFPYMISASDDHTLMIWNVHPKINKIKKEKKKTKKKFIHPFLRELTKYHSIKN